MSQENVDRWTRTARLPIRLALTEEGVILRAGVGGIRMSETLADLEVSGPFLRLAPKRMTIVGVQAPLTRFIRGYLPLPPLPKGAHLTEVRPGDGRIAVTFALARARRAAHPRHHPTAALADAAADPRPRVSARHHPPAARATFLR